MSLEINPIENHRVPQEAAVERSPALEPSYLILIQRIVQKMLEMHTQVSEKNRNQTEQQKKKFTKATEEWSQHQRKLGHIGWYSTGASFGLMFLKDAVSDPAKPFVDLIAEKVPANVGNMFSSYTQATQKRVGGVIDLTMNDLSAAANKASSDASGKDQLINLLKEAYEGQKRAAQAG